MICHNKRKMNAGVFGLYFALFFVIARGDDRGAKLRYYYDTVDKYSELPITEAERIFQVSWYNSSRNTVIFCHGFTGIPTGPAVTEIVTVYLEQGESNVALLNWEHLASSPMSSLASSYANWAAPNARQLGVRLVDTLLLLSEAGLDLNRTHLIGHSLGAQVWGIVGFNMWLNGVVLPWITGLDPASVGFERKPPAQRLSAVSAEYVDIIHTDPNKYGIRSSAGVVDFYPNFKTLGPVRQPGCSSQPAPVFSPDDLCSHNLSWRLLADAIRYPGTIIGSYAKNYRVWKNYSKEQRNAITLPLGEYNKNVHPGNYYLVTNAESPYGLKTDGL